MSRDHSQNHYGPNASFDGYDSDLASAGILIESLRQQLSELKSELKVIGKAIDDPRTDLTMTMSEVIIDQKKQLAASQKREVLLRSLIDRLVGVTPGHPGQCSGLKCREPYCYSCKAEEEADAYLQEVWNLCGEAREALAATSDLDHLILCEREPHYLVEDVTENGKNVFNAYRAARRPEC